MMLGCRDCKNAIFHEQLGEYKCKIRKIHTKADKNLRCKDWAKGTPASSKNKKEEE